jgi:anion-transporting  ArsA/GET3 family ATPase
VARVRWDDLFAHEVLLVSGKGGTGKSTVAAALATFAASGGRRVLLAEIEGRGEIARTLGVPDPGFEERPTPFGPTALSITPREAAVEYLHLYMGMDRVTRRLLRSGFLDQVIEGAPGFRDLLICGKLLEITRVRRSNPRDAGRPVYDLVVVDAPPTGQIAAFLRAPAAFADLIRVGRMKRQAAGIDRLLRTRAGVVLVATLEEMSVVETIEAIPAMAATGVRVAAVVANRVGPPTLPKGTQRAFSELTAAGLAEVATKAGLPLSSNEAEELRGEAEASAKRGRVQARFLKQLRLASPPVLEVDDRPGVEGPDLVRQLAAGLAGRATGAAAPGRGGPSRVEPPRSIAPSLDGLLDGAGIVVVCGSGGVGKTTISAALAVRLAEDGRRTALLTVDPARRLSTALRLPVIPGERTEVPVGRGRIVEALQLDTQRTFDELIHRYAGSEARRDRILQNHFYQRIADTLAGTHEYMAMEKLYELAREEDHQAIVIDTPPTRSALSFLDAPARLQSFLGGKVLRWLLWPTAHAGRVTFGMARLGATAFARTLGRVIGSELIADTVEFLTAFEGMYGGFTERAGHVLELLGSKECAFVVVTSPGASSLEEAGHFLRRLSEGGMGAAAVVVNRWHPEVGPWLGSPAEEAVGRLATGTAKERAAAAVLRARLRAQPRLEAESFAMGRFAAEHPTVPLVAVPELPDEVHDVPGLRAVGRWLLRPEDQAVTPSPPEPGASRPDRTTD